MSESETNSEPKETAKPETGPSFFDRPGVRVELIPVGKGVPLGIEQVTNPVLGIGGAYGAWGESYDNATLPDIIGQRLGQPLPPEGRLNLSELGFDRRHVIGDLTDAEHVEVELEVASRFLSRAAQACGWQPQDVDAVLVGVSGPVCGDFLEQAALRAGIPEEALKVSVHKACDGSVGALNLALNPTLDTLKRVGRNLADELRGKKVLVGGIEGLTRFTRRAKDLNALQLFGSAAGVIGLIPGKTMQFLVGKTHEVFDNEGVLAVRMYYPHSKQQKEGESLVEASQNNEHSIRVAGLMHEPEGEKTIDMAVPMGMVKLFVRNGVQVVQDVYQAYIDMMNRLGSSAKISVSIVHHANYKINQLKEKHLQKIGITLPMPWLLREFGNVSAASNMIAFLRWLPRLKPGDHVMFDGFGAGTYYDVLVVAF
jgi:3-oxoacyl-[acyl-carrier-protein] synthase III